MIIFMILTCASEKYQKYYQEKYEIFNNIKNKLEYDFIFVSANLEQNEEFIYNNLKKIVYVKCHDNYDCLPTKVYLGIKYIVNNFIDLHGILKLDDTSIMSKLHNILNILTNNKHIDYFGSLIQDNRKICNYTLKEDRLKKFQFPEKYVGKKYPNSHFCHGCGYYISLKSCNIILANFEIIQNNVLEDTTIGHILNLNNIFPTRINNFDYNMFKKSEFRRRDRKYYN